MDIACPIEYCDRKPQNEKSAGWNYGALPKRKSQYPQQPQDLSDKEQHNEKWPSWDNDCREIVESSIAAPDLTERERVAVDLYAQEVVSQEIAARIAGLSRGKFLELLSRSEVSPFQYTAEELQEDLMRVQRRRMGRKR